MRGLPIDALAVASAWSDLLTAFPILIERGATVSPALNGTGGAGKIAGTTAARRIHIVNPHGGPWVAGSGPQLTITAGGNPTMVSTAGPHDFPAGATIAPSAAGTMRLGWATNGTLAATAFSVAPLGGGASLVRDFIRICAVDLTPFLLGNRTASNDGVVDGCDAHSAAEPPPVVRDGSAVRLSADGLGALGEINVMLGQAQAAGQFQAYLASTEIEDGMAFPSDATPASRWPAAPTGGNGAWNPATAADIRAASNKVTVNWATAAGNDVVVTIPGGALPAGAHVRVYPRVFSTAASLWESGTLFRGNGGAVIAPASGPTAVYLVDPLNLAGQPPGHPPGAHMHFDLHVLPRPPSPTLPRERIFGGYDIPIADAATPVAPPGPAANLLGTVPLQFRAVSSGPIFGTPPRSGSQFQYNPPGPNVTQDILDAVNALSGDTPPPRESPRLPTMARTDTLAGVGVPIQPPPASGDKEAWHGVLMGGPLTHHSHRELYLRGNPGGPAGKGDPYAGDRRGWAGRLRPSAGGRPTRRELGDPHGRL